MNWYKKIIHADKKEDYLRMLGATQDIISFILSSPDPQFLLNEFRKNPSQTVEDLKKIEIPQGKDPYLPQEYDLASRFPEWMNRWVLVQLKKIRKPDIYGNIKYDFPNIFNNGYISKLSEIQDWAGRNNIELASYDLEQAAIASNRWHKEMAEKGKGKKYEEKNIVYGPQWIDIKTGEENKKWQGWTIQLVQTENDLQTEGNKMDNCVADYYDDVAAENTRIFSLRDPQNEPHVTMEVKPGILLHFAQIEGRSHSDPKEEYKQMISYWIKTFDTPPTSENSESPWSDMPYYYRLENMNSVLANVAKYGDLDEYGFANNEDWSFYQIIDDLIRESNKETSNYRDNDYDGDIAESASLVVAAAIKLGPQYVSQLEKAVEEFSQHFDEELDKYNYYEPDPHSMPKIDDEEWSDEQYEEVLEKWREEQSEIEGEMIDEYRRNHMPYGFIDDLYRELNKAREKGLIKKHELV